MNMFTAAQLLNKNTVGTTYYDTKSGGLKYSPCPNLTMMGYDGYDVDLGFKNSQKPQNIKKSLKKSYPPKEEKPKEEKPKRKVTIAPDNKRCCANKSDGSQCTLQKYKTEEMCYIHYKKTLPKPIPSPVPEVDKKTSKKWFSFKWW